MKASIERVERDLQMMQTDAARVISCGDYGVVRVTVDGEFGRRTVDLFDIADAIVEGPVVAGPPTGWGEVMGALASIDVLRIDGFAAATVHVTQDGLRVED